MPGFILDASVTLPWRFEDEATVWTEALLNRVARGEEVIVPAHWALEVANGLLTALRRGRVTAWQVREFCEDLAAFPIRVERAYVPEQWSAIISLAERHGLTVYDASYLELSQRYSLPLATLDRDLRKAARAASVPLVEPLS